MRKGLENICLLLIITCLTGCGLFLKQHSKTVTIKQKLQLTQEQVQKEKELKEKTKQKIKPIIHELKTEHKKYTEMVIENSSSDAIKSQKEKINKLVIKTEKIHENHIKSFEKILNVEQKEKFDKLKVSLSSKKPKTEQ